LCFLTK